LNTSFQAQSGARADFREMPEPMDSSRIPRLIRHERITGQDWHKTERWVRLLLQFFDLLALFLMPSTNRGGTPRSIHRVLAGIDKNSLDGCLAKNGANQKCEGRFS